MKNRLSWVDEGERLSIAGQCAVLGVSRSSWYYEPALADSQDDDLMKRLDRLYTDFPFYGVRRMVAELRGDGLPVCPKLVRRLLREMGLMAIYPKPRLSLPAEVPRRFPYLLRSVRIERPDHVWSTDITYLPMARGHLYLTAIIDWYSRYVLAWELADTLETEHSLAALDRAMARAHLRFSTATRAPNSPARPSQIVWRGGTSWSVGMGAGDAWTMCSWSASGGR